MESENGVFFEDESDGDNEEKSLGGDLELKLKKQKNDGNNFQDNLHWCIQNRVTNKKEGDSDKLLQFIMGLKNFSINCLDIYIKHQNFVNYDWATLLIAEMKKNVYFYY